MLTLKSGLVAPSWINSHDINTYLHGQGPFSQYSQSEGWAPVHTTDVPTPRTHWRPTEALTAVTAVIAMTVVTGLDPRHPGWGSWLLTEIKKDLAPRHRGRDQSRRVTGPHSQWGCTVMGQWGCRQWKKQSDSESERYKKWRRAEGGARLTFSPCWVVTPFQVDTEWDREMTFVSSQCSTWPACAHTRLNGCPPTGSIHLPLSPGFIKPGYATL